MKLYTSFFLFFLLVGHALFAQPEISLELFATGLTQPTDIENAGDERLFITEQQGIIKVISGAGTVLSTPFLDIRSRVGDNANERGLLGLAFHPDYANNGYFFVNYTNNSGDTRVSRFSVSEEDPNQADPDSEVIILEIDQPYSNHNGGCIKFGPDGYLYIGMGDGGSGGDPYGNGQNGQALLAKILRIDIDTGNPYGIPADNPFVGDDSVLDEIWALGVRNPWRFSFDRETGDLWIADVGQDEWEEIDFQPAESAGGENYGWNCYEGFMHYEPTSCGGGPYMPPIHSYPHDFSTGGCSVTGGYVYRGTENPGLTGWYLYTDYCTGIIWALHRDDTGEWVNEILTDASFDNYSTFGENSSGELFIGDLIYGKIYKIVESCTQLAVSAQVSDESCLGDANGMIALAATGEGAVTYTWSNGATLDTLENLTSGDYTVTVSDASGCQKVFSFTVGNSSPSSPTVDVFDDHLAVAESYAGYQWYLDEELLPDSTNATIFFTESGDYSLEVTNEQGCTAFSDPVTVIVQAVSYPAGIVRLDFIPNPTKDYFQLRMEGTGDLEATARILDTNGRVIHTFTIEGNKLFTTQIMSKEWAPGVYFVIFQTNKGHFYKKVIKQ